MKPHSQHIQQLTNINLQPKEARNKTDSAKDRAKSKMRAGPEQNQRPAKDRNYPITAGSSESFSPHDHMNLIRLLRMGLQICFSRTTSKRIRWFKFRRLYV
jgi:hypothetical protein